MSEELMTQQIRDLMDRLIEELDTLEHNGMKRVFVKSQVGKIRWHLSNYRRTQKGKWMPTIPELHQALLGDAPGFEDMFHFLKMPQEHQFKKEYIKLIHDRLMFIHWYHEKGPERQRHRHYGPALGTDNWPTWVDEYGLNVLDSQRRVALKWREAYKKQHGKLPYRHEVRPSDPTPEVI